MKKLSLVLLLVMAVFLSACSVNKPANKPVDTGTPVKGQGQGSGSLDKLSTVATHNTPSDCWMLVDGQVYNVTSYIAEGNHPGGDTILQGCGKDASSMFDAKHKPETKAMLANYLVK